MPFIIHFNVISARVASTANRGSERTRHARPLTSKKPRYNANAHGTHSPLVKINRRNMAGLYRFNIALRRFGKLST